MNGGRMMRKVVQHRHVSSDANHFEPPLDALEAPQAIDKLRCAEADVTAHRNRRQRIPDVVQSEQRRFEVSEHSPSASHSEPRQAVRVRNTRRLPRRILAGPERCNRTDRAGTQGEGMRLLLLGADSPHALALGPRRGQSGCGMFGHRRGCDVAGVGYYARGRPTRFAVTRAGTVFGHFESPLLGLHNVRNALAAIAVGSHVGLGAAELVDGLRSFKGIKRRLEVVGIRRDVTVLDDFAHHPTAVHETLAALRTGYPSRRVWAVFEPRSASSCRRVFQQDFAAAFGAADEVVIAGVFRLSLPESERLSAEQLVDDLRRRNSAPAISPPSTTSS